jgi:leucyl aminopeptidase
MQDVHKTPAVTATAGKTRDLETDLLIVPVFENDDLSDEPDLDRASGGEYTAARQRREFGGKLYEQLVTPIAADGWKTRRALFVGAGPRGEITTERLRRIATIGGLFARQRHFSSVAIVSRPAEGVTVDRAAQALAEGAVLANYEGTSYKTSEPAVGWLERVELRVTGKVDAAAVDRGRVLGDATNTARALSNEPGNVLTPRAFAERAAALAKEAGLGVEVLDESRLRT